MLPRGLNSSKARAQICLAKTFFVVSSKIKVTVVHTIPCDGEKNGLVANS